MLICLDMMSAATNRKVLGERLERLTGDEAEGCVPEYKALAKKIVKAPGFPEALRQVKALADENRLLAVYLLKRRGELCACEIQAATGLSHATVSHHMAVLVAARMVDARREGKWMYYRLKEGREGAIP